MGGSGCRGVGRSTMFYDIAQFAAIIAPLLLVLALGAGACAALVQGRHWRRNEGTRAGPIAVIAVATATLWAILPWWAATSSTGPGWPALVVWLTLPCGLVIAAGIVLHALWVWWRGWRASADGPTRRSRGRDFVGILMAVVVVAACASRWWLGRAGPDASGGGSGHGPRSLHTFVVLRKLACEQRLSRLAPGATADRLRLGLTEPVYLVRNPDPLDLPYSECSGFGCGDPVPWSDLTAKSLAGKIVWQKCSGPLPDDPYCTEMTALRIEIGADGRIRSLQRFDHVHTGCE
jgi:hypothetical protein